MIGRVAGSPNAALVFGIALKVYITQFFIMVITKAFDPMQ